jgi:hypothetical protein
MAEPKSTAESENGGAIGRSGGIGSLLLLPFVALGTVVSKVWNAITSDGTLEAAARQGADELGAALKAFPDSIQTQETGTIWNPTQGEVAASRQHGRHTGRYWSNSSSSLLPPTSEVAEHNRLQPGQDHGHDNGHDAGHSM